MVPSSMNNKMTDRNRVLKQQERFPCEANILNDTENDLASKFDGVESDGSLHFPSRVMGDDGYYHECVVCDNGGNLLCCDICPCNVPAGNWECPNCYKGDDLLMPLKYFKRSSTEKTSSCSKARNAPMKKLGFPDTPVNRMSSSCPANENPANCIDEREKSQTCCRTNQIKVYRRSRFKSSVSKGENLDSPELNKVHCCSEKASSECLLGTNKSSTRTVMSSMAPGENLTPRLSNRFSILSKPSEEANMDLEKNTFDSARREEKPTEEQGGAIVPRDVDEDVCVNIPREYEQVQHKVARAKRITMVEVWFEEELDALWLGVRRYGPGNWEAMLKDPTLRFSKFKTSEDLSERWKTEKQIILHCEKSQAHINLQPELQSIVSSGAYYEAARPRGLMKIRRASTSSRQSLVTVEAIKLRPECQTSNLPFTSLPLKNKKKPMDGKSKATKKPKPGLCNTIMDVGRTDDSSATESELSLKEWCARKEMSSEGTISD